MRVLTQFEMSLVSGGAPADPSMDRAKPEENLNGNGKAIGWCYGFGNLKVDENGTPEDKHCAECGGPPT